MGLKLAPGTGFCEAGENIVFLDLARDKYLALRGEDRAAFARLRSGETVGDDAAARLLATGLFCRGGAPASIEPASVEVPTRDLAAAADAGFSLSMTVSTAFALRWARRAMRPDRIGTTIASVRKRKAAIGSRETDRDMEAFAASYAANRWLNPVPQRCLVDALALDRLLMQRGMASVLVFGVRMSPFRAHCWLQSPSAVLTGTSAEARNFMPILVVR